MLHSEPLQSGSVLGSYKENNNVKNKIKKQCSIKVKGNYFQTVCSVLEYHNTCGCLDLARREE